MEVIQGESQECVGILSAEILNGKITMLSPDANSNTEKAAVKLCRQETLAVMPKFFADCDTADLNVNFPTTFFEQFCILIKRKFTQQMRNTVNIFSLIIFYFLLNHSSS